jgi:hypothetical protein
VITQRFLGYSKPNSFQLADLNSNSRPSRRNQSHWTVENGGYSAQPKPHRAMLQQAQELSKVGAALR